MPQKTTTKGDVARVFAQKSCGEKWVMLGCLGITGIELDPKSLRYEVCIDDEMKVQTTIIDQEADPRPLTITMNGTDQKTRNRYMALVNRMRRGCPPNLLLAQLDCPDPNSAGDPRASASWLVLYGLYLAASTNFGNNTYLSKDAKSAALFELQTQVAFGNYSYNFKKSYSQLSLITDPEIGELRIDSIAFLDDGKCADGTCVKCGGEGCQIILVHTNIGFQISLDGGATWNNIGAAAAAGHANAYDGKLFRVDTTNSTISVSLDGVTFTTALTDVAFVSPTNIVKFDVNFYGVAGANGQMWWSTDGGANWVQVRPSDAAETDFIYLCYNKGQDRLWSIGPNAGATFDVVEFSDDKGKTFTIVTAGAVLDTRARLYCADHAVFAVIDKDLYVTQCDAVGSATDLVQRSIVGADGFITGIGACDPKDCNFLWLTTSVAGSEIYTSIDGGRNWAPEVLPDSLSITPSTTINPVACCHSVDGDKVVFGFGLRLFQTNALDSFFE